MAFQEFGIDYNPSTPGSIKRNAATNDVSWNEVERALGKWFTGVRERDGCQKRRCPASGVAAPIEDANSNSSRGPGRESE